MRPALIPACACVLSLCTVLPAAGQLLPDEMTLRVGAVPELGDDVELHLTKRSLRSARYRIGTWSEADGFRELAPFPVRTFRGHVTGTPVLRVNANIEPGGILNANFSDGRGIHFWGPTIYHCSIADLKIDVPAGRGTKHMSAGNRVVPLEPVRPSPSAGGYLVPPVPMRRIEVAVEIGKVLLDDLGGNMELAMSQVEQRLNDTDFFYARDLGVTLEIVTTVIRLDASGAFNRKVFQQIDGGNFPYMHTRFAGSKSRPNYFGGSGIYRFKGAGLNVKGFNVRGSSGVGHELGHNFTGMHQIDKFDCMNGARSEIGPNNTQLMIRHCMSIESAELFPAVRYNGRLPPRAMDDFGNTDRDATAVIDVLDNDYDGNGDELHLQSVQEKSLRGGAVAVSADRLKAVYTPPTGFVGMDRFSYTVVDRTGVPSQTGRVKVRVSGSGVASYYPLDRMVPAPLEGGTARFPDEGPWGAHGVPLFVDDDYAPLYRGKPIPVPGEFRDGVRGKGLFNTIAGSRSVAVSFPNTGDPGRGGLSVSLWVLFPGLEGPSVIICKGGPPHAASTMSSVSGWGICRVRGGKGFSFSGCVASNRPCDVFDRQWTRAIRANTWYHLAMVIDRDTKKLRAWVNGEEALESEKTSDIPDGVIAGYGPTLLFNTFVWKRQSSLSALVDELRIYTSALTPEQVASLYAEGRDAAVPVLEKAGGLKCQDLFGDRRLAR